jgi:hypothetical protein
MALREIHAGLAGEVILRVKIRNGIRLVDVNIFKEMRGRALSNAIRGFL